MAFPPPFPNPMMAPRIPGMPPASVPFAGQKFGFFSDATATAQRPGIGIGVLPGIGIPFFTRPRVNLNMRGPRPTNPKPTGPPTTTTVFIGNITEKCPDTVLQEVIKKCGSICNWKRMQDSNGKFKAFGFCDFMYPDGAKKALSVLKNMQLGEKRLNVKADEATEKMLAEFSLNRVNTVDEETDEAVRAAIRKMIEEEAPDLVGLPLEEDASADKEKSPTSTKSRERRRSRSTSRRRKRSRKSPARSKKRSRHRSSSSSSSGDDSDSSSASSVSSRGSRRSRQKRPASRKRKGSAGASSGTDSVDEEERRKLKREIKEKEESYAARLKKWEEREKRRARQYAKDEEEEKARQRTIQKEAKKLRQFLEDYQDERDDPKYYKGSALFQRRRNFEREREADAKDRQEERRELDEMRKEVMGDAGKKQPPLPSAPSPKPVVPGVPLPVEKVWSAVGANNESTSSNGVHSHESPAVPPPTEEPPASSAATDGSPGPQKKIVLQKPAMVVPVSAVLNGVFEEEEEEVDTLHEIKKKIKPFEITREDRIHSITPEERKKLIKDLIGRIPTERDTLFAFRVDWAFVDGAMMAQRVQPWVNKKICEYIGEEEPSLVSFICEKVANKTEPHAILHDLQMVLDDEAEVFMVKLWRLIVYESEAKRLGLSGNK